MKRSKKQARIHGQDMGQLPLPIFFFTPKFPCSHKTGWLREEVSSSTILYGRL